MSFYEVFVWSGPGYYACLNESELGGTTLKLFNKDAPLSEVSRYCKERLYSTPMLRFEPKLESKDTRVIMKV